MSKKEKLQYVLVIFIVGTVIALSYYVAYLSKVSSYNKAINYIGEGNYSEAISRLCDIDDNSELKSNYGYSSKLKNKKCFKNSFVLYCYAYALDEYKFKSMNDTKKYLDYIPEDYSGELCEEIKAFKLKFESEYEEFLKEEEREAKERQRIKDEKRKFYSDKVPHEGMSEEYIDSTLVGKHTKYREEYDGTHIYEWYVYNTRRLRVTCENGAVKEVRKNYNNVYRKEDGTVVFEVYSVPSYNYSKKSDEKSDPYNVYDYDDPEDFYDDNYDDFDGYEDAEDYYDEHME